MNAILKSGLVVGDLQFEKFLGRGGQAEIWKCKEIGLLKREVAAKVVVFPFSERQQRQAEVEKMRDNEALNWPSFAKSTHVLPLYGAIEERVQIEQDEYIILGFKMEYSELGDLGKYLEKGELNLPGKKEKRQFLLDITEGIKRGHDYDLVHCDIKPANVLLFQEGGRLVPKVMDFGMSISADRFYSGGGTPEYMAPEQFDLGSATKASDVYSLGVLFYHIIAGQLPFNAEWTTHAERVQRYKALHKNKDPDLDKPKKLFGEQMELLLAKMLAKEAALRPDLHTVLMELKKQERESTIRQLANPDEDSIVATGAYRWNVGVHTLLGNTLFYFIIRGSYQGADVIWLRNNLSESRIKGYALYRVLGGYDYILRIWLKPHYNDRMREILGRFRDGHGGHFIVLKVTNLTLFSKSQEIDVHTRGDLLKEIVGCSSDNKDEEFRKLKAKRLVTSRLNVERSLPIRFFLAVKFSSPVSEPLLDIIAAKFSNEFKTRGLAKQLSIYQCDGEFNLLFKFRLGKFQDFVRVYQQYLEITTEVRRILKAEFFLYSQTFVEMDPHGFVESDDGSVAAEVNEFYESMHG